MLIHVPRDVGDIEVRVAFVRELLQLGIEGLLYKVSLCDRCLPELERLTRAKLTS